MSDQSVSTPAPPSAALDRAVAKLRNPLFTGPVILSEDEAAALLAKLEAGEGLAKAAATGIAFCEANGGFCMEGTSKALAAYRNPPPKEPT